MRFTHISLLVVFIYCLGVYTGELSVLHERDPEYFFVSINYAMKAYLFPPSRITALDLSGTETVDLAYIVSSPLGTKQFKCFFHAPTRGAISEPFEYLTLFSSQFEDAEYLHCYDIIDKNQSLGLLELADGTPLLALPTSSGWLKEWQTVDGSPVEIRRVALIAPAEGVKGCEVKTTDGSIESIEELGRLEEISGTLVGVSCRRRRWFG